MQAEQKGWRVLLRKELAPLLLLVIIAGGILAFVELSDEVKEGGTAQIDRTILLAMRNPQDLSDPIGPKWFEEMERDFTALGGVAVLMVLTLTVCGFLVLDGKNRAAGFLLMAVLGGLLFSTGLKHVFQRPRPNLVPHGSYVYTTSFPSGHSMLSAATYLTMGALLARVQSRRRLKIYLMVVATMLTLLVGISRVYLGVHWPTDVLAGWTAGGVWALICWMVARKLQHRGEIEQEGEKAPEG
jgi:undecaprenyl-diphosphatase